MTNSQKIFDRPSIQIASEMIQSLNPIINKLEMDIKVESKSEYPKGEILAFKQYIYSDNNPIYILLDLLMLAYQRKQHQLDTQSNDSKLTPIYSALLDSCKVFEPDIEALYKSQKAVLEFYDGKSLGNPEQAMKKSKKCSETLSNKLILNLKKESLEQLQTSLVEYQKTLGKRATL